MRNLFSWYLLFVLFHGGTGCHLIFPFDVDQADAGAGGDAIAEGVDLHSPRSDLNGPCGDIDTPPLAAEQAKCSCATTADDCDGIPSYDIPTYTVGRDPEPDDCNELLYEETFSTDPAAEGRWKPLTNIDSWSWSCGWLHQGKQTSDIVSLVRAEDAGAKLGVTETDAHYLVEARLKLGEIFNPEFWEAGIVARISGPSDSDGYPREFISCVVRIDKRSDGDICYGCSPQRNVVNPDLKIESRNDSDDWFGAWPLENPPGLYDPTAGRVYQLQMWFRPANGERIICRLYDDSGTHLRLAVYEMFGQYAGFLKEMPRKPGTVGLRAWGRAASFDYIRVFRLKTAAP